MAGKKISELNPLESNQIVNDDLITLVDSSETVISDINKKVTINQFNDFLKNRSSVFPISFQPAFIETKAYGLIIDGNQNQTRNISSSVSNKTVNIADISTLSFDQYGRVWNLETEATAKNILLASGTAASFYKGHMGETNIPGPSTFEDAPTPINQNSGGFISRDSYYWPSDYGTLINYSDGTTGDRFWSHLFSQTYETYDTTTVKMNFSYSGSDTNYQPQPGTVTIEIDWKNSTVSGTGSFPYYNSTDGAINFPVIWTQSSIPNSSIIYEGLIQGAASKLCVPKLSIDGLNKKITGLPISTLIDTNILNLPMAVNISITSS